MTRIITLLKTTVNWVTVNCLLQPLVFIKNIYSPLNTSTYFNQRTLASTPKTEGTHVGRQTKKTSQRSKWKRCLRFRKRRRGTAIVDTPKGILVVSENGKKYDLPGGAAKDGENQKDATLRELEEETKLKTTECFWLFDFKGRIQRDIKGGFFIDLHKVYLTKVTGIAQPNNEIKYISYTKNSKTPLSYAANQIIKKYFKRGLKADYY
ncbi:MAG: NUDIX domain-containing protein [Nitrososphaerota archaeon]|uniref:NUDIX domain-containing protein n=1 Tax=Candidatus Bathycorpusculum sp. TaxID=2994959 RepID=UPI0028389868|nr:NUDIX domain-containing protein [Candidatus Termiticorpusculum sp.]MDR0460328.1 NUDIX domain-containing protein [Nitrososphaerota archaeon]